MKKVVVRILAVVSLLLCALILMYLFSPAWPVAGVAALSPQVLFSVDIDDPIVALTIDDGPDPVATEKILDVLEENVARATFFVITDEIVGNEELIARMLDEGHELGNHSVKDERSILLDEEEFERKLVEAGEILDAYGDVRWFRPGSGIYDREMVATASAHGYRTALGSVHPFDPQIPSADYATWYVLHNVEPGAIIVLHDRGARGERTAEALGVILPELNRRGYQVVTLSEMAGGS
jgi:peptidoglycan/xylan/chitin deacetylase (PgdA/CDA1 family)